MQRLAPGMQVIGTVLRHLGASVSEASDERIAAQSGAAVPEPIASVLMGVRPAGVITEDRDAAGIPVRIYRRESDADRRPLILYFHGGGFVFGDLRGGDWIAGTTAKQVEAVVVSVDYRLAPRFPFPAAVEDCFAASTWAAEHAAELGADPDRIGVMGESAGGNLAAVVALLARDAATPVIRHQALLYPLVGLDDSVSRRVNADAVILTAADRRRFDELYAADPDDWRYAPIKAPSHAGLPPAVVVVAGHDPLHDDGTAYADALRAAGVAVQVADYPAMAHGFLNFPRFARSAVPAMKQVVFAQRRALASAPRAGAARR